MWRHGDVLIASTDEVPAEARKQGGSVLAQGEITGHSHRIKEAGAAEIWMYAGIIYLKVLAEQVTVVHEEHKPITLPQGIYQVWQQREYTPRATRRVVD